MITVLKDSINLWLKRWVTSEDLIWVCLLIERKWWSWSSFSYQKTHDSEWSSFSNRDCSWSWSESLFTQIFIQRATNLIVYLRQSWSFLLYRILRERKNTVKLKFSISEIKHVTMKKKKSSMLSIMWIDNRIILSALKKRILRKKTGRF